MAANNQHVQWDSAEIRWTDDDGFYSFTTSTTLGPKMGMESTSLSRLLNTMEERELISRKPNPEDGRGVLILLTKKGKQKRDLSKKIVLEFNNGLEKKIDKKKINNFYEVIAAIKNQIEEEQAINYF